MRPNLRSPALPHLVILAVPAAAFLYVLRRGRGTMHLAALKQGHAFDVVRLREHVHDRGSPDPIAATHERDQVARVRRGLA